MATDSRIKMRQQHILRVIEINVITEKQLTENNLSLEQSLYEA